MASKTTRSNDNPLQWILERGEEVVGQVAKEFLSRRSVTDGLAKMVHGAVKTKGKVDKNVETMLHLLNLPSRTDYNKLLVKIEHLQGSLVNLNMKLDRLIAAQPPVKKNKPV